MIILFKLSYISSCFLIFSLQMNKFFIHHRELIMKWIWILNLTMQRFVFIFIVTEFLFKLLHPSQQFFGHLVSKLHLSIHVFLFIFRRFGSSSQFFKLFIYSFFVSFQDFEFTFEISCSFFKLIRLGSILIQVSFQLFLFLFGFFFNSLSRR